MHWLYLLIAVALMVLTMKVSLPGWLVFLLIIAALGFGIAWMLGWVSSRISRGARNDAQIISPEDLRRLREQADARKASDAQDKSDA